MVCVLTLSFRFSRVICAGLGDYAIKLRSMTQGRGSFVSQFERYDEAPVPVQEKVIAENKARMEALNKE